MKYYLIKLKLSIEKLLIFEINFIKIFLLFFYLIGKNFKISSLDKLNFLIMDCSSSNTKVFINDIPDNIKLFGSIAIDTEAMGLKVKRDRLCCVQMCDEIGNKIIIHYPNESFDYSKSLNLKKILTDRNIQKIFHFARFDLHILRYYLAIERIENVFCTKIASKLSRTYTDKHGLKTVVQEICKVNLDKQQQCSNWGSNNLTDLQISYAISDVIYLHEIKKHLEIMLSNANRLEIAQKAFDYLDNVVSLDIIGFEDDLFAHFWN